MRLRFGLTATLLALGAAIAVLGSPRPAWATTYVDDPLTSGSFPGRGSQGGSFGPNGFTTSAQSDSVWYEMSDALPSGRVEFTVTGLALGTTLVGNDNDVFTIYQAPTGESEPIPYWPWRNNDFKVFLRIFGTQEVDRPGAMKLELSGCPRGAPWWHDDPCPDGCNSISGIAYANNGKDVGWDAATSYRIAVEWGNGAMTFFRDGAALGTVPYPGDFAPQPMRIRLGTPRDDIPVGITLRDVLVTGTSGNKTPICALVPTDAGTNPDAGVPDAGPAACDPTIQAISLSPADGSGPGANFVATYRNCLGASAFRVVQMWVGESVGVGVPNVQVGYEAGKIYLEGQACSPGEKTVLKGQYAAVDCSQSSAAPSGNDLTMTYALSFDTAAFAGARNVYFDAKGPSSLSPEPRLGWTLMGKFVVAPGGGDGGTSAWSDSGIPGTHPDAGGGAQSNDGATDGGCACTPGSRNGPSRGFALSLVFAGVLLAVIRRRRRGR